MRRPSLVPSRARLAAVLFFLLAAPHCSGGAGGGSTVLDAGLDQLGPYPVGIRTVAYTDESRPDDEFSQGPRYLTTEIWYPAAESARGAKPAPALDWIPKALKPLVPLLQPHGDHLFAFDTGSVRDAAIASGTFPLIGFSHGHMALRYQSFTLCEHLASHGFVVMAPDHIGNAIFAERADGSIAFFSDAFGETALDRRIADMRFLFTTILAEGTSGSGSFLEGAIDSSRGVGMMGHSFGGSTTVATAAQDSRITAAMPMAAATFADRMPPFTIPSVTWISAEDKTIGLDDNASDHDIFAGSSSPRAFASIRDGGHYTFSDACVLLPGYFLTDGCGQGTRYEDGSTFTFIARLDAYALIDSVATAFFSSQLGGDASMAPLLRGNPSSSQLVYESAGF